MANFAAERLHRAGQAVELVAANAAQVSVRWLAAGTVLFVGAQAARQRGWYHIIRAAYPGATRLRTRDVVAAYFAGAGLNGFLPARGGDVVKLAWLHRRIEGSSYVTLAATLVPETAFETLCGVALVVWALGRGFIPVPSTPGEVWAPDVSLYLEHPVLATLGTVVALAAALVAFHWARRRSADLWQGLRRGLAIFASPCAFIVRVVSWQALGPGIRLASLACSCVSG
jgi:Lysylphosphatidylglycerol synthase TM region